MRKHTDVFSRALSWWCHDGDGEIEHLLNRIVFELGREVGEDIRGVAILLKRKGSSFFVTRSLNGPPLPQEILCSLFVEHLREGGVCRVKDHALDTVRLLEGHFRTSILVSFSIPATLVGGAEAALWFGLRGVATAESRIRNETLAKELTEWLSGYSDVISALTRSAHTRVNDQRRIAELTALLHDARAPLGVLKYLSRDECDGNPHEAMSRELEYLDRLLAQGAPRSLTGRTPLSDVRVVLARVRQRYALEVGEERIRLEGGYDEMNAATSDIDVERILTNVVSNAFRHSPGCRVSLRLESRENQVIVVAHDDGRGIPRDILRAINNDEVLPERSTAGWGVGLQSCQSRLHAIGGSLRISSEPGHGTTVEISLPLATPIPSRAAAYVADSAPLSNRITPPDVVVIDDDQEHGESLNRLLLRFGIGARHYSSIDTFIEKGVGKEGAIVLCDANMPDGGAERLLSLLTDRPASPRIAVMSGEVNDEYLYRVSALGAQAFFAKPVDISEVCTWIREVQGMGSPPWRVGDGKGTR